MIASTSAPGTQSSSLYDRLGGMPAIRAVVDNFVSRILADNRLNTWFAHVAANPATELAYKTSLADFLSEATGGPCHYRGPDMARVHRGRAITGQAFDAVVEDLLAALNTLGVPAEGQSALLAILGPMKTAIVERGA